MELKYIDILNLSFTFTVWVRGNTNPDFFMSFNTYILHRSIYTEVIGNTIVLTY